MKHEETLQPHGTVWYCTLYTMLININRKTARKVVKMRTKTGSCLSTRACMGKEEEQTGVIATCLLMAVIEVKP